MFRRAVLCYTEFRIKTHTVYKLEDHFMKKLFLVGPGKTVVKDVPKPEIKDDEILIKVKYYGVCMSEHDAWLEAEGGNGVDEGFGHEPLGVVEAIGSKITKVKVGDRVTGCFAGNIAEYNTAKECDVYLVPDGVRDEDAIGEPLACLLSAVSKVPMSFPGESSVAVVGCGYMGCGAISLLKLRGAGKVVAVDIRKECLEDALRYGADEAYLPEELPDEYLAGWEHIGRGGFDYVMEWGETNESLDLAIRMTKMCGFLGIGSYHTGGKRLVDVQLLNVKAIDCLSTHPREADLLSKGFVNAMELLGNGKWNYKNLPVKIYPMSKFDLAHQEIKSKYGKYMKAIIDCEKQDGEEYIVK